MTLASGESSATVDVTALTDTIADDGETVILTISPTSSYNIGTATASATLHDATIPNTPPEFDSDEDPDAYAFSIRV